MNTFRSAESMKCYNRRNGLIYARWPGHCEADCGRDIQQGDLIAFRRVTGDTRVRIYHPDCVLKDEAEQAIQKDAIKTELARVVPEHAAQELGAEKPRKKLTDAIDEMPFLFYWVIPVAILGIFSVEARAGLAMTLGIGVCAAVVQGIQTLFGKKKKRGH